MVESTHDSFKDECYSHPIVYPIELRDAMTLHHKNNTRSITEQWGTYIWPAIQSDLTYIKIRLLSLPVVKILPFPTKKCKIQQNIKPHHKIEK